MYIYIYISYVYIYMVIYITLCRESLSTTLSSDLSSELHRLRQLSGVTIVPPTTDNVPGRQTMYTTQVNPVCWEVSPVTEPTK